MEPYHDKIDERIYVLRGKQKKIVDYKKETLETIHSELGFMFQLDKNFFKNVETVINAKVEKAKKNGLNYQAMESSLKQVLEERYIEFHNPMPFSDANNAIADICDNKGKLGSVYSSVMEEYDTMYNNIGLTIERLESIKEELKRTESPLNVSHLEDLLKEDYNPRCIRVFFVANGDTSLKNMEQMNEDYIRHMGAIYTQYIPYEEKIPENPHPFSVYIWDTDFIRSFQGELDKSYFHGDIHLVPRSGKNGEIFAFGCKGEFLNELHIFETEYLVMKPSSQIISYDPRGYITKHFMFPLKYPESAEKIKTCDIVDFYPDENNNVWVLTNEHCICFSRDGNEVIDVGKSIVCRALCVNENTVCILYADEAQNNFLLKQIVGTGERNIVQLVDRRGPTSLAHDVKASILYVPDYNELFVYFKTTGVINAFSASTGEWVREYYNRQTEKGFFTKGFHLENNSELLYVKKVNKMILFSKGRWFWYYYAGVMSQSEPTYHDILDGYTSLAYFKIHDPHSLSFVVNRVKQINTV